MAKLPHPPKRELKERRGLFALSLRDDFSQLILKGLRKTGWKQRELAKIAGCGESFISRFVNVSSDFEIGTAAKVLAPLNIWPVLVDKADLDRLIELERRSTENVQAPTGGPGAGTSGIIASACAAIDTVGGSTLICGESRTADTLGGPRSGKPEQISVYRPRGISRHVVLSPA